MKNVFGLALESYWKGDRKTPYVIRRDDDHVDRESLGIYFTNRLYPIEKEIIASAKGKILDVGCGVGRHTLYFQKRGFDISGVDISPKAIKVSKERGCRKVRVMDIYHAKFPPKSFDTILLFGHNIGIGGTLSGAEKLLKSLRKLIKINGVLLLTTVDVTKTKNKIHKEYHKRCRTAGRYIGSVKMRIEYKDHVSNWFLWLHIEPKELNKIAKETNWKILKMAHQKSGQYAAVLQAI